MSISKIIVGAFLLLISFQLQASPASPEPVVLTQPDGKSITVYMKGNEAVKRMETLDGYTLLYNSEGYMVYAVLDAEGNLIPSNMIAADESVLRSEDLVDLPKHLSFSKNQIEDRKQLWKDTVVKVTQVLQSRSDVPLQKKVLCVLVNFNDKQFTKTQQDFDNMMNQAGYSTDGSQGSVREFFTETSYGEADVSFTVVGPITLSHDAAYYGANNQNGNDVRVREFAAETANKVAELVDFSEFDADNNKYIDGFHIIFAGRGEEAGGGADCIWSHKWSFAQTLTFNGKWLQIYSCSPELYMDKITTIGVICHELSHSLFDIPDYYDTGDEGFLGTGKWDLMSTGSWNGTVLSGDCPAHINMYEKERLGWVPIVELMGNQAVADMPNSAENPVAYKVVTPADGGYFLLENKQKKGFDKALPGEGLLIWRVNTDLPNYKSSINDHHPQLLYPVCASSTYVITENLPASYGSINTAGCPFPGSSLNTSFDDNTIPSMRQTEYSHNKTRLFEIKNVSNLVSFNIEDNRENYIPSNYHTVDKEGLRIFLRQSDNTKNNFEQAGLTVQDTVDWYVSDVWVNKISTTKGMDSYETSSGILWNNSIPNRIVAVYWRAKNFVGILDAANWSLLKTLYCNDNLLTSVDVSENVRLNKLFCQNNNLRFSTLPVKMSNIQTYVYSPQKKLKGGLIHFYDNIDLSKEFIVDGNTTTYTWYDITERTEKYIQPANNFGNFMLTSDLCGKKLRCKMQNAAFPDMSGSQSLMYEVDVIQPTLKVYPIPTNGLLTVDHGGLPVGTIKIYDAMRRLMLETTETTFNIGYFPKGIYYLKVNGKTIPIMR